MAIKISETFEIGAPVDQVWQLVSDPTKVATCLPGAELTQVIDDKTYEGKVKVKVGPILASYKGRAGIEELDQSSRTIRVAAEGKETAGAGLAKAEMVGMVESTPSGGTKVTVNADVDHKFAQFGGGIIQEVARQIFKQFADNVQMCCRVLLPLIRSPSPLARAPRQILRRPLPQANNWPWSARGLRQCLVRPSCHLHLHFQAPTSTFCR
jgi:uncharacterized protein